MRPPLFRSCSASQLKKGLRSPSLALSVGEQAAVNACTTDAEFGLLFTKATASTDQFVHTINNRNISSEACPPSCGGSSCVANDKRRLISAAANEASLGIGMAPFHSRNLRRLERFRRLTHLCTVLIASRQHVWLAEIVRQPLEPRERIERAVPVGRVAQDC